MSIVAGGNGDFNELLRMFTNKEEVERRIAVYKQTREAAEKAVALTGPAAEIPVLRSKAASALEKAKEVQAKAEAESKAKVKAAQDNADAIVHAAEIAAVKIAAQAAQTQNEAKAALASATGALAELEAAKKAAVEAEVQAKKAQTQAKKETEAARATRVAYEDKCAQLTDALARMKKELDGL